MRIKITDSTLEHMKQVFHGIHLSLDTGKQSVTDRQWRGDPYTSICFVSDTVSQTDLEEKIRLALDLSSCEYPTSK